MALALGLLTCVLLALIKAMALHRFQPLETLSKASRRITARATRVSAVSAARDSRTTAPTRALRQAPGGLTAGGPTRAAPGFALPARPGHTLSLSRTRALAAQQRSWTSPKKPTGGSAVCQSTRAESGSRS